ncbi:hypothetical protein D046_5338B, partial [Vibrio parahaemolyticus V-223/04]
AYKIYSLIRQARVMTLKLR